MRLAFLAVLVFSLCIGFVSADATYQYAKVYASPFYRESMAANTNYTSTLGVNPPDGVSKVINAMIGFNAQINGQTQNFSLWVNGKTCNNPNYYIATAFSTTGNVQFSFDCSNVITVAGNYSLTMRSAVNTGVVSGWLDLAYQNKPKGSASVSGTEYRAGDPATIFVQLKDAEANPINNGSCYVDIYYPKNSTGAHPYTVSDAPMLFASGDDGLYYYDIVAPDIPGVYMVSAKCAYAYNWQWIYPSSEFVYAPTRTAVTGTWTGATRNLNNPEDGVYDLCNSASNCVANYSFNLGQYGGLTNITGINLYWVGEATKTGTLTFSYWNGTTFVALPNTVSLIATGTVTQPSGVDQFQSNVLPVSANRSGVVTIQVSENVGSTHAFYNNWLALAVLTMQGTIQEVKGNSEMQDRKSVV